jgi:LCP family protein required for cell wall assembly
MAGGDKPYRVYRGGRQKGRVPVATQDRGPSADGRAPTTASETRERRRRIGWGRALAIGIAVGVLVLGLWAVLSTLAVRSGVTAANDRLENGVRATLAPEDGLLLSHPTTILLLGTDHATNEARSGLRHSDSILLVRTEPKFNRISYLSIPRDLLVDIPGFGRDRVNTAYQVGGAPLALRTIRAYTGIPINHVAIVDFARFEKLIDELGGITIDVPKPIVSKPFDCPYTADRCARWEGWRFARGEQTMDGRRALVYARIRVNKLDPAENDITRGGRQQEVLQAIASKLTSPGTLARMPFLGDEVLRPLATDISTWEFAQLGWRKFRADKALRCRLGGDDLNVGGRAVLSPVEENRNAVAMFMGTSAPQPPPPGAGPFAPGCIVQDG